MTKDELADDFKQVIQYVAGPEGMCICKITCNEGGYVKGRF